jgi:hypothetical protein
MMFGIFSVTAIFEILVLLPEFYMLLQFFMPPSMAFMLSCLTNLVTLTAIVICRFKPGPFVYKAITLALSVLAALFAAGISPAALFTAIICMFIFSRVKTNITTGRDIAIQLATATMITNILLALIFFYTNTASMAFFGYTAICISTVTSIIILIVKQVDESRRFGKNSMNIGSTQRKNNQIFAGIILAVLFLVGSFGQVTTLYKSALGLIGRFFALLAGLLSGGSKDMTVPEQQVQDFMFNQEAKDPSLFDKIIYMLVNIIGTLLVIGFIVFCIYHVLKLLIRLFIKLVKWFGSGEHTIEMVTENGHTDEKESLLDRNLKNLVSRFQNLASGILKREVPYDKLPDDTAKVRRLMKYFIGRAGKSGVKVTNASTAQEICRDAGGISPVPEQFNALLAECYDKARYDNTAPSKEQLGQLEEKLLKH